MATARQPDADAAGDANLSAVHPAANRAGEPGRAGNTRQSVDSDLAVDPRGHHENPGALVRLRHRHPRDPRAGHLPPGLSAPLAVLQADGLAGFAFDREGTGARKPSLILRARVPDAMQRPSRCFAEPGPTSKLDGPRISSAPRRKSGALRSIRGTLWHHRAFGRTIPHPIRNS